MRSLIELLTFLGLPMVAASALAVLIKESIPLTLNELSEKTGYAKSHLSMHLKHLVFNGLVKIRQVGRKKLYYAEREVLTHLLSRHLNELKIRIEFVVNEANSADLSDILLTYSRKLHEILYRDKQST